MITYRWSRTTVNLDNICRDLWRIRAIVMWDDDPICITFLRLDCRIELYGGAPGALLISGPTKAAVRSAAAELGYRDIDETIAEIKDEVAHRPQVAAR